MAENAIQGWRKTPYKVGGKRHTSKNTTKNSSQNSAAAASANNAEAALDTRVDAAAVLVEELISHGVSRAAASRFVGDKPEVCRRCLTYLPYAQYRTTKGTWLANAIKDEFGPPAAYEQAIAERTKDKEVTTREQDEEARKTRQEARSRAKEAQLRATLTRLENEQGDASAAFAEHVARERAKVAKIAAHLSPDRAAQQLAAFDQLERRLQLFEEWLNSEEGRGVLRRQAFPPPTDQGSRVGTESLS